MEIDPSLSDVAVLAELGRRLERRRLELGFTQARLAKEAGVSKRTVERLEAGASTQLTSLIRLLRTLSLFDGVEALLPPATPGPMDLLQHRGKTRRRARAPHPSRSDTTREWEWGDDS